MEISEQLSAFSLIPGSNAKSVSVPGKTSYKSQVIFDSEL